MLKEFKEFISKGNIIDLAVGVVIGGAFQSIINSLVSDIIMPVVSIITGSVDFSDMKLSIPDPLDPDKIMVSLNYGNFITSIVNFLIIALTIFLVVSYLGKLSKKMEAISLGQVEKISKKLGKDKKEEKEEVAIEPENKICPYCLTEIKYKATRCPHCTSELEKIEIKK
jgi:large conductance mechanosensitive channel